MNNDFKTFIKNLENEPPSVCYECAEDAIVIEHEIGNYSLEFRLHYSVETSYFSEATFDQPEEFELEFENKEIDDIELSIDGEPVELEQKELDAIYKVLYNQLLK